MFLYWKNLIYFLTDKKHDDNAFLKEKNTPLLPLTTSWFCNLFAVICCFLWFEYGKDNNLSIIELTFSWLFRKQNLIIYKNNKDIILIPVYKITPYTLAGYKNINRLKNIQTKTKRLFKNTKYKAANCENKIKN